MKAVVKSRKYQKIKPRSKTRAIKHADVFKLAKVFASKTDMCAALKIDFKTLNRHFSADIDRGMAAGRLRLRNRMALSAIYSVPMQIHLSKQYLGHAEKVESKTDVSISKTPQQLLAELRAANGEVPDVVEPS